MNATVFRRILFALVPVELAFLVMLALGVDLPTPLRLAVLLLLSATIIVEVSIWIVTFRRNRRDGLSGRVAAKEATRHVIGDRLWGFITAELGLVTSIARLITRRPSVPEGAAKFTYHRQSSPMMWTMVALILVEVIVIHLVIPWETVRLIVLVLSVYSLIWVIGFIAGFMVHPHLVKDDQLVVRHGSKIALTIPFADIERLAANRQDLPGTRSTRYDAPQEGGSAGTLRLAQGGQTNVEVTLTRPLHGGTATRGKLVRRIHIWADDPSGLIRDVPVAK